MSTQRVLGVDACRGGWMGVALQGDRLDAYAAAHITHLVDAAEADGEIAVVAIDIPIGLPEHGDRTADRLARKVVGPRWPSVFMTPVRVALQADDHATANRINRDATDKGVSAQAFGLRRKLFEVEDWVRRTPRPVIPQVVEVHPEVSFAQLAGAPLTVRKSCWAGSQLRQQLLADADIRFADDLGKAGRLAAVDDVLDAGAAAWTARRFTRGEAHSLPDPPETLSDGSTWDLGVSRRRGTASPSTFCRSGSLRVRIGGGDAGAAGEHRADDGADQPKGLVAHGVAVGGELFRGVLHEREVLP